MTQDQREEFSERVENLYNHPNLIEKAARLKSLLKEMISAETKDPVPDTKFIQALKKGIDLMNDETDLKGFFDSMHSFRDSRDIGQIMKANIKAEMKDGCITFEADCGTQAAVMFFEKICRKNETLRKAMRIAVRMTDTQ
jgi:hypothetical protein